jgi:hypothetical protein
MISDESAIPYCPYCGAPLYTAFRGFEGYKGRSSAFTTGSVAPAGRKLCILELGVGFNTPGVIRWPFER